MIHNSLSLSLSLKPKLVAGVPRSDQSDGNYINYGVYAGVFRTVIVMSALNTSKNYIIIFSNFYVNSTINGSYLSMNSDKTIVSQVSGLGFSHAYPSSNYYGGDNIFYAKYQSDGTWELSDTNSDKTLSVPKDGYVSFYSYQYANGIYILEL